MPLGGGVMAFLFWSGKDSKTGRKRPKKLLHSHFNFFKVVEGNPIKYMLLTFLRFSKIILKECVSDYCHKGKPRRSKLSSKGRN